MSRSRGLPFLAALIAISWCVTNAWGEVTPADQKRVDEVKQSLEKIVELYKKKNFEELGQLIQDVEGKLGELKSSSAKDELSPLESKLAAAQRLLKNALDVPAPAKTAPTKTAPVNPKAPPKAGAPGEISFVKDIAPIFVARCQGCHINRMSAGLSLRTYSLVMKGSDAGRLFTPGRPVGSALMDVLEGGQMPPNNKLGNDDLNKIAKWIEQGGKLDAGTDPEAALTSLVPGTPGGGNPMTPAIVMATGREKVSFMRDIAPVLVAECVRCHSGQQGAGNLLLSNFNQVIRGGRNAPDKPALIVTGNPSGSLMIQKLRGMAKQGGRMPQRSDPLPEDTIKKFETWIAEGAKFDGETTFNSFRYLLDVAKARASTHEALAEWRSDLAQKNWSKASPNNKPEIITTDDHIVVGRLSTFKLQEASKQADSIKAKIASSLRLPTDKPLFKGKLTIFLFDQRFEVTEHARMVDGTDMARDVNGFFEYDVIDNYCCLQGPKDGDTGTFPALLTEQMMASYVMSLGSSLNGPPKWFAIGTGRMMAGRLDPKSPQVKLWEEAVPKAMASTSKLDAFTDAAELDATGSALAYGMAKYMATGPNAARFTALMESLRKGTNFNAALQQTYGADAKKLAAACFK